MITIDRRKLLRCLNSFSSLIDRHSKMPCLMCVRIFVRDGKAMAMATNLETYAMVELGDAEHDFDCLINHREFLGFVRNLSSEGVRLELHSPEKLLMENGSFQATLDILNGENHQLPSVPEIGDVDFFEIDPSTLTRAATAASKEPTRYYLNGVFVQLSKGGSMVTATNGHILLRCPHKNPPSHTAGGGIVPTGCIKAVSSLARDADSVLMAMTDTHCSIKGDGFLIVSKLVDGDFPDVSKVIPKGPAAGVIKVSLPDLITASKRVCCGRIKNGAGIKLTGNGSTAKVESIDGMSFVSSDIVDASIEGAEISTGFKVICLETFAKIAPHVVAIETVSGHSGDPFTLRSEKCRDTMIIMPMRY